MDDRRKEPRKAVDEIAYIFGDGMGIECRISDLSASGAAIVVRDAVGLPQQFKLMAQNDRIVRNCRVVWMIGNRIGVGFADDD